MKRGWSECHEMESSKRSNKESSQSNARPTRLSKECANSRIMSKSMRSRMSNDDEDDDDDDDDESVSDAPSSPFYSPSRKKRARSDGQQAEETQDYRLHYTHHLRSRAGTRRSRKEKEQVVNGHDEGDEETTNGDDEPVANGVEDEDEDEGNNDHDDAHNNDEGDESLNEANSLRSSRRRRRSITQNNTIAHDPFVPLRRSNRTRRQRLVLHDAQLSQEMSSNHRRLHGRSHRRSRQRRTEIGNLDKYSSDDEFKMSNSDDTDQQRSRRRNRRIYNMRENRQQISRLQVDMRQRVDNKRRENSTAIGQRNRHQAPGVPTPRRAKRMEGVATKKQMNRSLLTSSSSASSSSDAETRFDEARFERRKTKRMNIERRKLLPLNLCKDDILNSKIRDRQKIGSSLADVAPMELDLNLKFSDVGGLEKHVSSLKEMVLFPLLYPDFFTKFGVSAPRGVLFHGPPGTGKTLVARALACECSREGQRVAFFMRKGADCLSKWIGESERQLRMLFDQAFVMRPSIIFFDEIDGLAPVRSSRQDQIHSSIVSTLLALMDGLDSRGEVIVIGATNRLEHIDPALRRPGRFDRELRFDLPAERARLEILTIHTKQWKPRPPQLKLLQSLATRTTGYCGADLKGLCAEAALNALRRRYPQVYETNQKLKLDLDKVSVSESDFYHAMELVVPSSQRSNNQVVKAPLATRLKPLLTSEVNNICGLIRTKMTIEEKRDKNNTKTSKQWRLQGLQYSPRFMLVGSKGNHLNTYVVPAVLHQLESLPCHKIDLAILSSGEQRSVEETLVHTFQQAVRTAPCCIYVANINILWDVWTQGSRQTFLVLLDNLDPTLGVLLLASSTSHLPSEIFKTELKEVFEMNSFTEGCRKAFFEQIFDAATARTTMNDEEREREALRERLEVVPVVEICKLSEKENKKLRKKEEAILRELRIFLRDTWAKINREQKFFMFRSPVDTKEAYDYLELVEKPMDLQTMLRKLDDGAYTCAQHFLDDIDLIANNALKYNNDLNFDTNRIICHRAHSLKDFAYALVKAEMDTDFEEECKSIDKRRKEEVFESQGKEEVSQRDDEDDTTVDGNPQTSKSSRPTRSRGRVVGTNRHRQSKDNDDKDDGDKQDVNTNRLVVANGDVADEEDNNDNSTTEDNEGKEPLVDKAALQTVLDKAVSMSANWDVEQLERLYFTLMKRVVHYTHVVDRRTLPEELNQLLDTYWQDD